jgi:hypothetical protein
LWKECEIVIPEFDENGNLPLGVHFCEWEEFNERFGTTVAKSDLVLGYRSPYMRKFTELAVG